MGCTIVQDKRKERHLVPFERQRKVAPRAVARRLSGIELAEEHLRFELDDLVAGGGSTMRNISAQIPRCTGQSPRLG